MSVSAPSAARLVTGVSASPHVTMPEKCSSSGATLRLAPVQRHPAAHAHPDTGDLCPSNENADLARKPLALDAEMRKRRDQPVFEKCDEGSHVAPARSKVEHDIGHALARAVIGEAPAAPALEHGEPVGRKQLARRGTGAGGVDWRMLQEPHAVRRLATRDGSGATIHGGDGLLVGHETPAPQPFNPGLWSRGKDAQLCRRRCHKAWL